MKYNILTVVTTKNTVLGNVTPYILVKIYRPVTSRIQNCILLATLTTSRTLLGSDSVWVTEIYAFWKKPAASLLTKKRIFFSKLHQIFTIPQMSHRRQPYSSGTLIEYFSNMIININSHNNNNNNNNINNRAVHLKGRKPVR
jgi:hypothetical protein